MPDVCLIIHLIIRLSDMGIKVIHRLDAIRLLESGQPVDLRVWKLSTGDIIEYKGVICIGSHWRRYASGQVSQIRTAAQVA